MIGYRAICDKALRKAFQCLYRIQKIWRGAQRTLAIHKASKLGAAHRAFRRGYMDCYEDYRAGALYASVKSKQAMRAPNWVSLVDTCAYLKGYEACAKCLEKGAI